MGGQRDPHDLALGRAIHKLRKEAGLTQQQLADRAEIPLPVLRQVEAAHTDASWGTVRRLAYALDVSLPDLLRQAEDPPLRDSP
jgi:XRE family transcriptional regulator, regulator of sulfur utilization